MPIKDLILGIKKVPQDVYKIALGLPYRDFITVGLVVKKLKISKKHLTLNQVHTLFSR